MISDTRQRCITMYPIHAESVVNCLNVIYVTRRKPHTYIYLLEDVSVISGMQTALRHPSIRLLPEI